MNIKSKVYKEIDLPDFISHSNQQQLKQQQLTFLIKLNPNNQTKPIEMNSQTFNVIFACALLVVLAFAANVDARGGGGGSIIIMGGQNHGHGHHNYIPYPVMMGGWGCGHGHSGWGWGQ
ncbi:uncharacterized protein LOC107368176 [Tetranychus urticae]|nr:uncharacterized protein LOC107368176 [Tetranychus urticae]